MVEQVVELKNQWTTETVKQAIILMLPPRQKEHRIKEVYNVLYSIHTTHRIDRKHISPLTTNKIIKNATRMGLIEKRGVMKKDNRVNEYQLTDEGELVFKLLSNLFSDMLTQEILLIKKH